VSPRLLVRNDDGVARVDDPPVNVGQPPGVEQMQEFGCTPGCAFYESRPISGR
jgi:hypothetical protein